ncbi:MAG: hypothetical protein V7771_12295 [Shewanella psychromarinicola]|uniref:hypothetical protein n=1 Tax=Shewanella psychromarinicola TaxID=2487742 RepID=UPI00300367EA
MDSINETIDNFDVWLVWLKRAAYMSIILFISIILSYFFNFATWPLTMSSLTADWSAFGSLLAGAASFLGAIGTVGVMLLGIKQFKIQQTQIVAQTKRQDNFEEKQDKKWAKENEILNFQKYQIHKEEFRCEMLRFEKRTNGIYEIYDKDLLYARCFENNNLSDTELSTPCNERQEDKYNYLDNLIEKLSNIQSIDKKGHNYIINLNISVGSFIQHAFIESIAKPMNGYVYINNENLGIDIKNLDNTINMLDIFMGILLNFCNYKIDKQTKNIDPEKFNPEKSFYNLHLDDNNFVYFEIDNRKVRFPIEYMFNLREFSLSHKVPPSVRWNAIELIRNSYSIYTTDDVIKMESKIRDFQINYKKQIAEYDKSLELDRLFKQSIKSNS